MLMWLNQLLCYRYRKAEPILLFFSIIVSLLRNDISLIYYNDFKIIDAHVMMCFVFPLNNHLHAWKLRHWAGLKKRQKKTKSSNNNENLSQKAVKGNILKKNTLTWRASTLIKWTKYCMSSNILGMETYCHHKPQKLSKENSYKQWKFTDKTVYHYKHK